MVCCPGIRCPVAVVEDDLGLAISVGVEQAAGMGKAVPLRRILAVEMDGVVADDIRVSGLLTFLRMVEVGPAVAHRGADFRRKPARIERIAARSVQRQAEAKGSPSAIPSRTFRGVSRLRRRSWSSSPIQTIGLNQY